MASTHGQVSQALTGGLPTVKLDVPILAVFMVLFVALAAGHMTVLQVNQRRQHKFIISGLMFGFCMSRIGACALRIAWAVHPSDKGIAIAAQVFVNAGILLVYIVNNILAARMLRSAHPGWAWSKPIRLTHRVLLFLLLPMLVMVIVAIILALSGGKLSVDPNARRIETAIQRAGLTYLTVIAVLPFPILLAAALWPKTQPMDHFGRGSWRTKLFILFTSTALACTEAGFREGTIWAPRPATNPGWWHSKAAFYCFNFMLDIFILALFLGFRIDQRFHVKDKSNGPGDYSAPAENVKGEEGEGRNGSASHGDERDMEKRESVDTKGGVEVV